MKQEFLLFFLFAFISNGLNGQDYGWWNNLVQWDGKTPWHEYLQLSTDGLGPNALPVPTFNSLGVEPTWSFSNNVRYHHLDGDPTVDLISRLDIPFNERIAISMWMVTLEYFNTSTTIRDQRKIRMFEPKGFTVGDFYFATYFHALQENEKYPDIIVGASIKTASGNNIEGGRVTDTPGYYFDATIAKTFGKVRPYVASGLYVYQTYDLLHPQNDAIMYAFGSHYLQDRFQFQVEWAGYYGYLDIGDRPSVLRINYELQISKSFRTTAGIQLGMNDLPYHTIAFGLKYQITEE